MCSRFVKHYKVERNIGFATAGTLLTIAEPIVQGEAAYIEGKHPRGFGAS
jgi:hypothetical protein